MSDTLNTRVATDLTDCQNSILREEKSATEKDSPRRSFRSSSKT